jgi:hypothetical protein
LNEKIAAEREAATQALLASASNSQSTYVSRTGLIFIMNNNADVDVNRLQNGN